MSVEDDANGTDNQIESIYPNKLSISKLIVWTIFLSSVAQTFIWIFPDTFPNFITTIETNVELILAWYLFWAIVCLTINAIGNYRYLIKKTK